jgi:hypothetical protein
VFTEVGAIEFAQLDAGLLLASDVRVAEEFDAGLRQRDAAPA